MKGPNFGEMLHELALPPVDLSDTLAAIHIACIQLEIYEPGLWWDFDNSRALCSHPAVIQWMQHYGFEYLRDLTAPALTAFYLSVSARVASYDTGFLLAAGQQ